MTLKQQDSISTKTDFRSRNRILFVFLIFLTVLFVFAAQVEWVPYLNYSSSTSTENSADIIEDGSVHITTTSHHIPVSASESQPSPSKHIAATTPTTIPATEGHDGESDSKGNNNSNDNHIDKTDSNNAYIEAEDDTIDGHEYDPSPTPSRSKEQPIKEPLQLDGNKEHNPFLTMFPDRPPGQDEKFLAYLPHSGFHNQLITLENALRLAAYLNRTLLLPPLYMSHKRQALLWKVPPVLLQQWSDRNRTSVGYCREIDPLSFPHRTQKQREAMTEEERKIERECMFYHTWTSTPWTYFYDIPQILTGIVGGVPGQTDPIRVFTRPVMSLEWLEEHLGIQDPSKEIFFINDTSRYAYQIVDDSETDYSIKPEDKNDNGLTSKEISDRSRYDHELLLTDLQRRPEKVLHFGSLFAAERIEARSEKHKALRSFISHGMDLWNQDILDATSLAEKQMEDWRKQMGRIAPGFLGVHFRTEDGIFVKQAPKNLQRIIAWLGEIVKLDRTKYINEINRRAAAPPAETKPGTVRTFLERCKGSPPESPMIFMATDVHQPRHSPLLDEYLNQYPCTIFLSDFTESVATLDRIRNPVDGVHMLPYMIALMDANLAAKGREFQGTEHSTFTGYIMTHLWPEYHPDRALDTAMVSEKL